MQFLFIHGCSKNGFIKELEDIEVPYYDIEIPYYYVDYIKLKVEAIGEAVNASNDCSSFVFFTDAHWGDNHKQSPSIINHLLRNTSINDVIFGGDVITQHYDNTEDVFKLGKSFRMAFDTLNCNMYYIYGNHDNNSDAQPGIAELHLSDNQVYDYLQKGMSDCEYGGFFNFYFDRIESKTRFICLDTGRYYYPQFRNKVCDTARYLIEVLNNTPSGWRVVVLSHIWYDLRFESEGVKYTFLPDYSKLILHVLDDYNLNNSGLLTYESKSIPYTFDNVSSKVICCIGGHCHLDTVSRSNSGIPIIITTTDSRQTMNSDKAILGTTSEQSISAFILDYQHMMIKMIRIGRGEDVSIPIERL